MINDRAKTLEALLKQLQTLLLFFRITSARQKGQLRFASRLPLVSDSALEQFGKFLFHRLDPHPGLLFVNFRSTCRSSTPAAFSERTCVPVGHSRSISSGLSRPARCDGSLFYSSHRETFFPGTQDPRTRIEYVEPPSGP